MEEEHKPITIRAIIEIMGAPEEHVKKTMGLVVDKLGQSETFKLQSHKIAETSAIEGRKFWSIYCDVELTFKDVDNVAGFCADFMPSSIEVLHPTDFAFKKNILENLWNDLIAKLHHYDMIAKNLHAENIMLKRKMAQPTPADATVEKEEPKD